MRRRPLKVIRGSAPPGATETRSCKAANPGPGIRVCSPRADLRDRLGAAELELEDLRAIRDARTPPELPERPSIDLAAFLPAAERVSGDFYLVAEGPQDATILVVGDVVGHGLVAARRAAFTRTTFAATAPYSDDPCRLLG